MKCDKLKQIIEYETGLDLSRNTRRREYVQARGIYYYILRKETNMSLQSISETVKKNHATILHSVNHFDNWLVADPDLKKIYKRVLKSFLSSNTTNIASRQNNGQIVNSIMEENERLNKELLKMNVEVNKVRDNPLVDLVCEIPKEKQEEVLERIKLMVQSWSWKYEDKCEIIGGFNSVSAY
jgi:menaquinone-dependent protoporphyrinogen IX oxidase